MKTNDELIKIWIAEAKNMPYPIFVSESNFYKCATLDELIKKLGSSKYHAIGVTFYYQDLCFINQIDGCNEFLFFKNDKHLDNISCYDWIKQDTNDFRKYVEGKLNIPNNFRFQIKVFNDGRLMFEGTFFDWLMSHEGGDLEDILSIWELWLPLLNSNLKEHTLKDFSTGIWKIEKI